jgi:hypothetical protein
MSCITEILKLKGDQDVLVPEGNWIAVEGGGTYKDYEYLVVLNTNGHRCGYVAIPPEHKYSQTPEETGLSPGGQVSKRYNYYDLEIECHGGLTFMAPDHGLKDLIPNACNDIWIGFDCGHCWDACDTETHLKYFGEDENVKRRSFFDTMRLPNDQSVKSYHYAAMECESIIDQLIKVA